MQTNDSPGTTGSVLKPVLGTLQLWGIAVGLVISGEYFGWSYGWASAGTLADPDHSVGESRYITFGASSLGRLLAVSHTHRSGAIRIISARGVTRAERKIYEAS